MKPMVRSAAFARVAKPPIAATPATAAEDFRKPRRDVRWNSVMIGSRLAMDVVGGAPRGLRGAAGAALHVGPGPPVGAFQGKPARM